ncbi:GRAM-domain-containing protein [Obba rivulosa]|uniref:GRAM-domain-containing protein n=1 Tax=Obba rivulosa TaxID=1052685 RepID=A0A8E2B1X7_9APHY|nr:GRAM-domain-containing protein [Obba rivulosa]
MSLPPISPAETTNPSSGGSSSGYRHRRPMTPPSARARSRGSSMSYAPGDASDRDSYHSGHDLLGSDDEDEALLESMDTDDIPVTGFAVASNKRNQDFHELFPSVPDGDYLIEDYGCALQREILIQGRLYISENHICFHANIFGWITDLTIPMYDVAALDKRMTAFVIPNAIQVTTRNTKYTFTSFLSRDTTFDVLHNVWRLARPESSSINSLDPSAPVSFDASQDQMLEDGALPPVPGGPALLPNKHTRCACGKAGEHYPELCMECILPGTPEKIYNLMFTSGFMKDFMRDNQKLLDIQISDWMPMMSSPTLLARNMSYIKPLSGGIGPKSTKCELRDEMIHCDFDDYVCMLTTTRTPDVPSGSVFQVKTRTCIMWASSVSSKVIVTTQVEWTGRSFIKGIIEKSCLDGQKSYHDDLEKAMREYIHEHQSEFIPEGVDAAVVEEEAQIAETPLQDRDPMSDEKSRKAREHERGQRSLQWAYDTCEGAMKVAKQSTEGALELMWDAWEQSSSTTILYFLVVILVISNVWTLLMVGKREEAGRRKELRRTVEREQWVQGIVSALWEELLASKNIPAAAGGPPPSRPSGDLREEVSDINSALDMIEERVRNIRNSLEDLD